MHEPIPLDEWLANLEREMASHNPNGEVEVHTRPPRVSFAIREIPPVAPLYVTSNDFLVIRAYHTIPGTFLHVNTRMISPDGDHVDIRRSFRVTPDRLENFFTVELTEGFLVGCVAGFSDGTTRVGQGYVAVLVTRGRTLEFEMVPLLSSYAPGHGRIAVWPPGRFQSSVEGPGMMRNIIGTDPAPGNEILEVVPTNARWRLIAMRFLLVTSGAVANREVRVVIDDGTVNLLLSSSNTVQTASIDSAYNASATGVMGQTSTHEFHIPLPPDLILFQGWRIRTDTLNLQPGDDFGAPRLLVEEWIED